MQINIPKVLSVHNGFYTKQNFNLIGLIVMSEEKVILVDQDDNQIGIMEKMAAHQDGGILHRAFSIFLFNNKNQLLLQRRAVSKYHSGGLWTNTCCSHPRAGESILEAGTRRLKEELGITCQLEEYFSFIYKADLDNELTEYEFDHVLIGDFSGEVSLNYDEVDSIKWLTLAEVKKLMIVQPNDFTVWFKIAFDQVEQHKLIR
jgi:isopentenyl-diphosphate delta-isomerase